MQSPRGGNGALWELCTILGIARQHEALANVLAGTTVAGSDSAAVVQCQAEVTRQTKVSTCTVRGSRTGLFDASPVMPCRRAPASSSRRYIGVIAVHVFRFLSCDTRNAEFCLVVTRCRRCWQLGSRRRRAGSCAASCRTQRRTRCRCCWPPRSRSLPAVTLFRMAWPLQGAGRCRAGCHGSAMCLLLEPRRHPSVQVQSSKARRKTPPDSANPALDEGSHRA